MIFLYYTRCVKNIIHITWRGKQYILIERFYEGLHREAAYDISGFHLTYV